MLQNSLGIRIIEAAFSLLAVFSSIATTAEPRVIAGPFLTRVGPNEIAVWVQFDRSDSYLIEKSHEVEDSGFFIFQELKVLDASRAVYCHRYKYESQSSGVFKIGWNADLSSKTPRAGGEGDIRTLAQVKLPPTPQPKSQYTFAFGSCSHQEKFATKQPIWSAIAKEKPDCFLFIGDNMYLPNRTAEFPKSRDEVFKLFCDAYDRERQLPEMQPLLRSTMCFALWDDHDYGPNNSDRRWQWKDVALEAFKLYFPGEYGLPDAPGCFRKFSWGDIDVFMLDDRTFRDPNKDENRKTMFGEKQLTWLKEGLATSTATFKLVVCGNQMLSDFHPHEGWGVQFRPERDAFLRWLWDAKIEGVIFLAGDRHFAELIRKKDPLAKGEDLWELTSSPLANDSFKVGDKVPDGDRRASYVDGPNFGILRFDTAATPPNVKLILKDEKGKTRFQKKLYRRAQ